MGAGTSRNKLYEGALNKTIDVRSLNPYDVLDVQSNFTWDELVSKYRKTALLVHPDKGGSEELFNIVSDCFKTLAKEYKAKQQDKPHHVLKQDFKEYKQPASTGKISIENTKQFNEFFEAHKLEDEEDEGYARFMLESKKEREELKIQKTLKKFDEKTFNNTFDNTVVPATKDVIIYKEPEPLVQSRLDFTELGVKTKDFSKDDASSLKYTDYYKAHTTTRLVDPRSITERKEYRTVGEYEVEREHVIEKPLTKEEIHYQKHKELLEKQKEEKRLEQLKQKDMRATEHYEYINRLMLR